MITEISARVAGFHSCSKGRAPANHLTLGLVLESGTVLRLEIHGNLAMEVAELLAMYAPAALGGPLPKVFGEAGVSGVKPATGKEGLAVGESVRGIGRGGVGSEALTGETGVPMPIPVKLDGEYPVNGAEGVANEAHDATEPNREAAK